MNNVGKQSLILTISKMVSLIISMITAMLLSRYRSLEEYGTYSQLNMIVSICTSIFMLGIPNCLNYFFPRADTEEEKSNFLSTYYTISVAISAFAGGILVLIMPLFVIGFNNSNINNFWFFLLFMPFTKVLIGSASNMLIAADRIKHLIIYNICNSIVLLSIVITASISGMNFRMYIMLYVIVEVFFSVIVIVEAKLICKNVKISIDKGLVRRMFAFSIPLGLSNSIGVLKAETDKLIISTLYSAEQVAIYNNAAKELPFNIIPSSMTTVLLPKVSRLVKDNKIDEAINLWKNATSFILAIMTYVAACCIVYAEEIIVFLYSEKYMESIVVFRIYSLLLIIRCTYYGMMLTSLGKTKIFMVSSIMSLVLNVIISLVMYELIGFNGPAIATILVSCINAIFLLVMTCKRVDFKFRDVFPWKILFRYMMQNILFGVVFYYLHQHILFDNIFIQYATSIVFALIWAGIYFVLNKKNILSQWNKINK